MKRKNMPKSKNFVDRTGPKETADFVQRKMQYEDEHGIPQLELPHFFRQKKSEGTVDNWEKRK